MVVAHEVASPRGHNPIKKMTEFMHCYCPNIDFLKRSSMFSKNGG